MFICKTSFNEIFKKKSILEIEINYLLPQVNKVWTVEIHNCVIEMSFYTKQNESPCISQTFDMFSC